MLISGRGGCGNRRARPGLAGLSPGWLAENLASSEVAVSDVELGDERQPEYEDEHGQVPLHRILEGLPEDFREATWVRYFWSLGD